MSEKAVLRIKVAVLLVAVAIIFGGHFLLERQEFNKPHTEYECDVQSLNLNTEIHIKKGDEDFATVSGDVFRFVEDPLTMYDASGDKVAYAGDAYHFVAQDSHTIYVNNKLTVELVGLVDFWGNSYEIYDSEGKKVGTAEFNGMDTDGNIYNAEGELIADYSRKMLFNDFQVRISEDCEFDEKTVLMIFASYYSDKNYDNS